MPVMIVIELCSNGNPFDYIRNVTPPSLYRVIRSIMREREKAMWFAQPGLSEVDLHVHFESARGAVRSVLRTSPLSHPGRSTFAHLSSTGDFKRGILKTHRENALVIHLTIFY